ncbi:hypothetical protein [Streptomyces sp. NPDC014746]|uniref:hypothetical protein n=1 Tax=Streptomyces sp. NPDC014746 TaxID=3364904 RepID=UPI0036FE0D3A
MAMFKWWNRLADDERRQWTLDPFVSVGPLRFGMSPGEVSAVLSGVTAEFCCPATESLSTIVQGDSPEPGLKLYYWEERLSGIVVDALRGPQVFVDGVALVGRVPSDLEKWMVDRAETREPDSELIYMGAGIPGSDSLGVVIDVQRAGDHLLTRPVFVPSEAMDDLSHFLPRDTWSRY